MWRPNPREALSAPVPAVTIGCPVCIEDRPTGCIFICSECAQPVACDGCIDGLRPVQTCPMCRSSWPADTRAALCAAIESGGRVRRLHALFCRASLDDATAAEIDEFAVEAAGTFLEGRATHMKAYQLLTDSMETVEFVARMFERAGRLGEPCGDHAASRVFREIGRFHNAIESGQRALAAAKWLKPSSVRSGKETVVKSVDALFDDPSLVHDIDRLAVLAELGFVPHGPWLLPAAKFTGKLYHMIEVLPADDRAVTLHGVCSMCAEDVGHREMLICGRCCRPYSCADCSATQCYGCGLPPHGDLVASLLAEPPELDDRVWVVAMCRAITVVPCLDVVSELCACAPPGRRSADITFAMGRYMVDAIRAGVTAITTCTCGKLACMITCLPDNTQGRVADAIRSALNLLAPHDHGRRHQPSLVLASTLKLELMGEATNDSGANGCVEAVAGLCEAARSAGMIGAAEVPDIEDARRMAYRCIVRAFLEEGIDSQRVADLTHRLTGGDRALMFDLAVAYAAARN